MKFIIFGSLLVFLFVLIYIYIFRRKYTRERYAFFIAGAIISLGTFILVQIYTNNSMAEVLIIFLNKFVGTNITVPKISVSDILLSLLTLYFLGKFTFSIYRNWDGAKSQQEADIGSQTFINNIFIGIPGKKIPLFTKNRRIEKTYTEPYFNVSLDWHSDVAQIFKIISNKYFIDIENDWFSEEKLFICKFGKHEIAIFCTLNQPTKKEIKYKIEFVREHIKGELFQFIVSVKNINKQKYTEEYCNTSLSYRYKYELLNTLVDFSDYFDFIKSEYQEKEVSEGDILTLKDIYVELEGEGFTATKFTAITSIEKYILNWVKKKNTNKHISLLGEYGQGKSVLSLKIAYEMIENNYDKIPIIIELRGKSPRTLKIEDIIALWANNFDINPSGIMRLLEEGKLLVILEGFDEIDMVGDSHIRLEHFRRLWEFARYEKSKVLITGRPNLFLDNEEMFSYLNTYKDSTKLFYSEAIHFKPFSKIQIEQVLRNVDKTVKNEILNLLNKEHNGSFKDLLSRPSTLYQASVIWNELDKENINSASVIEHFLNHAYRRQAEKLRTIGRTGIETLLTNNERKYFMLGIAVGMVEKNGYTNQINLNDLERLVLELYSNIPNEVSSDYNMGKNLKSRMKDNQNPLESIFNDIRSSAILVKDLTKNDSFKFAHKSFLEYMTAKYFVEFRFKRNKSQYLDKEYRYYLEGIEETFNLKGILQFSDETVGFIVNMIKLENKEKEMRCVDVLQFISPSLVFINKVFFNRITDVLVISTFLTSVALLDAIIGDFPKNIATILMGLIIIILSYLQKFKIDAKIVKELCSVLRKESNQYENSISIIDLIIMSNKDDKPI